MVTRREWFPVNLPLDSLAPIEAVLFVVRTRGGIQVRRDTGDTGGGAEGQAPQTINRHRTVFIPFEQAFEADVSIERHDRGRRAEGWSRLPGILC